MDSYLDDVRYNIKHYRDLQKITQADLAEKCACSPGTIGGIESGRTKPSFDMMVTIAEALNVNPADLFITDASKSREEIKQDLYAQFSSVIIHANESLKKIVEKSTDSYN
ncbi:MAG: helix-turn-helix transcriptional regulator [Treponema sp.]|nr:helix-turn-helix transcriptional regulator [Treponema sp.]